MKRVLLAVVFIVAGALPAFTQMPMMRMPQMPTEFRIPPVGSWCEYNIVSDEDTTLFRYSLTGKEDCDEKECHWFEFQITEGGEVSVIKMLVLGDPNMSGNLKRLIIKSGDEPAIEIPVGMMQGPAEEPAEEEESEVKEEGEMEAGRIEVGKETIKTKAGDLECTHLKIGTEEEQADVWMNETVPFFNLVKLESEDTNMELVGYGDSGATTAITEEPQPMPMPGMPGSGE